MGWIYYQIGDYSNAIEYTAKGITIDEKTLGPDNPYTIEDKESMEIIQAKLKEQENESHE